MPALEFTLAADDVPRLLRWVAIRAGRAVKTEIVWHDTPDAALAAKGLALSLSGRLWRLTPLHASPAIAAVPVLAEARALAQLGTPIPDGAVPQARFNGRRRTLHWPGPNAPGPDAPVTLQLLDGQFEPQTHHASPCRLLLDGPAHVLPALAHVLAQDFALGVPRHSLVQQALATAHGQPAAPRALGAPQIGTGQPVTDSLQTIIGHLLDVMLHWADQVPTARSPEAVHQMRVATRRLRSALAVYKTVAACPDLAAIAVPLKLCAARLGTARDWDVFIGGLGTRLSAAFPDDPRCTAMMRATTRRRSGAYTELRAFLAGPDFRTLTVALACSAALRPWDATGNADLQQDTAAFAATVLARRMKRVRQAGRGIDTLPIPALHELRKDCKRLRYAAEFFAGLFPARRTRRFLQRLSDLQEELGLLNDSAAVSGLMAQLGRMERSYAAGLVEGFSAAHAGPARSRIEQAWKRFRATGPFWS